MDGVQLVAAVLGVACVWLSVVRNVWTFPTAIVSVGLVCLASFGQRLYSDALLQLFFMGANVYGWVNWARARARSGAVLVERLDARARWRCAAACVAGTILWAWPMHRFTNAAYPWWDAASAALSIAAQLLMARRKLENWPLWVLADVILIPLYHVQHLDGLAGLYVIYVGLDRLAARGARGGAGGRVMPRTICLHGPESTGKSTMAPRLAQHFNSVCVAEFGRTYCETFGIDLTMADLVMIAAAHDAKTKAAVAQGRFPVILDTDPLMSAVWADMMFGRRDPWFDAWTNTADLYLLFDIDLPWEADGTRMYGAEPERRRFFDLCRAELERRGVRWALIGGEGSRRYLNALEAIRQADARAA